MKRPDRKDFNSAAEFRVAESRWWGWYWQAVDTLVLQRMIRKAWVCPRCDKIVFGPKYLLVCERCNERYRTKRFEYGLRGEHRLMRYMAQDIEDLANGLWVEPNIWPREPWTPSPDTIAAFARAARSVEILERMDD